MDETNMNSGRIFEISSERQIAGRRKFKAVLHEIHSSRDQFQTNGISWDEEYTRNNLGSVANMSIVVEFINSERRLPYGHGYTETKDNLPLLEDATVVGHFERGYIDDIDVDGVVKRCLVAEGYIDEMRYPKFVSWLQERLVSGAVRGSVEIVGQPQNENRIIYDGGWKEKGRVPQIYDYSGYAILGIRPADDTAIVMELNNKNNKEDTHMDEKLMSQFMDSVKTTVSEAISSATNRNEQYESRIAELNSQIEAKDAEIAELNAKLTDANAEVAAKEQTIESQNTELNSLKQANSELEKKKKIAELNSALADFSDEEQALAEEEINAFKADPTSIEINSITSKICVEMVRKNKEAVHTEQNSAAPDIYGSIGDPDDKGDVDIFG